jgi:hypothetical protein
MKKLESFEQPISTGRSISPGLEERQRAAEAARQAEIANPSVRKSLAELQSAAEEAVQSLVAAYSTLAQRHQEITELESALQLANDEIIQLNHDLSPEPKQMTLKNSEARNAARSKADQLQTARDLEAQVLSSMPIPKTCLELERWRHGLQQAIANFARGEIKRNQEDSAVKMTETMLAESVEKDPRVTELARNSRLHRNAKSSFQQAAEAMSLLREKFDFLQVSHERISKLMEHGFQAKFCSWEWQRIWN